MTAPTIYFGGGEDCDHVALGTGCSITTTAGAYRSTYSRCALVASSDLNGGFWQNQLAYSSTPSSFWWGCRLAMGDLSGANAGFLAFVDSANLIRLQITVSGGFAAVYKVNTAGVGTLLTNTLGGWRFFSGTTGGTDKFVIHWVNSASGSIDIWVNGVKQFNYSGDTTTETTGIAYHRLATGASSAACWSEIIVTDSDCRTWNLQTLAPVANGNTHSFDTGTPAAANVNEVTLSDATLDGSTTPGQVDQYTLPSLAAGTYTILAVGMSARLQRGSTGPTKMDLGVRVSGTDYWSADQSLDLAWNNSQNWWTADPSISATWTGLPTNVGLKSVA